MCSFIQVSVRLFLMVGSTLPLYTFSMIMGTVSMVVGFTILRAFIRSDATGGLGR